MCWQEINIFWTRQFFYCLSSIFLNSFFYFVKNIIFDNDFLLIDNHDILKSDNVCIPVRINMNMIFKHINICRVWEHDFHTSISTWAMETQFSHINIYTTIIFKDINIYMGYAKENIFLFKSYSNLCWQSITISV